MSGAAQDDEMVTVSDFSLMDLLPPPAWFLFAAVIIFVLTKIIRIFSYPEPPRVFYHLKDENSAVRDLLLECPSLEKVYKPPAVWGRNGHIQTATYGLLGHTSLRRTADRRHFLRLPDGTTTTFDVFEPVEAHEDGDLTLVLCPGIANSSESNYIRTCVHNAQQFGYRCAVFNHLGALSDVELTSPKIFTYGGTQEFGAMVSRVLYLYPESKLLIVGFSMGGNIVSKYLGEQAEAVSDRIIAGISVCQGYDANKSVPVMHEWSDLRRLYMYIITENVKHLLRRNYAAAIKPHVRTGLVDEQQIWAATTLLWFDEHYSRKIHGFSEVDDYYKWCSCIHILDKIRVPMIFVNALDDPLVPEVLWRPAKEICESRRDFLFILTKHGGHLGFLEGRSFAPSSVTWLDKLIVELSDAAVHTYGSVPKRRPPVQGGSSSSAAAPASS